MKYVIEIVKSYDSANNALSDLEVRVQCSIDAGWVPLGPPSVVLDGLRWIAYQAITRDLDQQDDD